MRLIDADQVIYEAKCNSGIYDLSDVPEWLENAIEYGDVYVIEANRMKHGEWIEKIIERIEIARDDVVNLNNIKNPEYDHYINGWDDCISCLENLVEMAKRKTVEDIEKAIDCEVPDTAAEIMEDEG